MKPWLPALLLASFALAGGAEGPALPRLTLNATLAGYQAEIQTVPAVVYPDDGPYFQTFPTHVRAVLNRPEQRWKAQYDADVPLAQVAVYPVSGWLGLFKTSSTTQEVRRRIEMLRALTAGTLSVSEVRAMPGNRSELPFLPLRNAGQVTAGAVQRVKTPAVEGIRYLTVYSQEWNVRIPREAVFYTFQGLSRDGRFYVSVQMRYAPTSLPRSAELDRTKKYEVAPYPAESRGPAADAHQRKVEAYRADLTHKLNAEEGKSGIGALDALVRSIRLY